MNRYSFDNGAVELIYSRGEYKVLRDGKEIPPSSDYSSSQLHNPRLAVTRFCNAIHSYLTEKVKAHISEQGGNEVMGCDTRMMCKECIELGISKQDRACLFCEDI